MRKALRSTRERGSGTEVQNRKAVNVGESIASCWKHAWIPVQPLTASWLWGERGEASAGRWVGAPLYSLAIWEELAVSGISLLPWASSFPEHPTPLVSLLGNGCPAVVLSPLSSLLSRPSLSPSWSKMGRQEAKTGRTKAGLGFVIALPYPSLVLGRQLAHRQPSAGNRVIWKAEAHIFPVLHDSGVSL